MKICLYTEYFENVDQKILGLLSEDHELTIVSSKSLELPKSFWHPDNADRILGSFFIAHETYRPQDNFFPGLTTQSFDLILCCNNINDFTCVTEHVDESNIPAYYFDTKSEINVSKFMRNFRMSKIKGYSDTEKVISILTTVYNTNFKYLKECVESVDSQAYENFEWIIIDDGSDDIIKKSLKKFEKKYRFIKLYRSEENEGMAKSIVQGLRICSGEYVCFLDSDDILESNCLNEINRYALKNPEIKAFYSNEKKINLEGTVNQDSRKPDFDMELFYQCMYLGNVKVIHKDIIHEIGFPDTEFGRSWDYDYFLRIAEEFKIGHIRKFIYRSRIRGSVHGLPDDTGKQMARCQQALRAVREANDRTGLVDGSIVPTEIPWVHKIERDNFEEGKVKILILTKKNPNYLKLLLDSIDREVNYSKYEVIITQHIDDEDKNMTEFLETVPYQVNRCDYKGFNFAKLTNFQIEEGLTSHDDYAVILNDDIIFQTDCISEMVACQQDKFGCGIVGCKLIWPGKDSSFYGHKHTCWPLNSGRLQHCGVSLFNDKCCAHDCYGFPSNHLACNYVKKVDAVTFACVLINADILRKIKFDENLPVDYQDIDLCIRAKQELDYDCYYTPWAVALHFESVTKKMGHSEDFIYFEKKNREFLKKYKSREQVNYEQVQGL